MEMEASGLAETSIQQENGSVWHAIWNLKVPNVEKNFLWKACHDILPTRVNLKTKKIVEDPSCPLCGREQETTVHILWQCPSAMDA